MACITAFLPALPPQRALLSLVTPSGWACGQRRPNTVSPSRRKSRTVPRQLLPHIHTLPELVNQLIVSCGVGLAGIVGSKATSQVRAFTEGDRRADAMESLASDIDSLRRRQELSRGCGNREWDEVGVDKLSNIFVVPGTVPSLEAKDELDAFDSLLGGVEGAGSKNSNNSLSSPSASGHDSRQSMPLPPPSEFVLDDENDLEHDLGKHP